MKKYDFNFQQIVEAAKDVIIVTKAAPIDPPGPEIVYVNEAFTGLTGYTFEEAIGRTPRILQSTGTSPAARKKIRQALEKKEPVRVTIKNYTKSGKDYWLDLSILPLKNESGVVTHFAAIERDVTDQKELEIRLHELSRTDQLTGLPNRRMFNETIKSEYSRFCRTVSEYSLLMLDIDHFKAINDTHGHSSGDRVLEKLGEICQMLFRSQDTAARVGGEEFCILLSDTTIENALVTAERLRKVVSDSVIHTTEQSLRITVSIGVSAVARADTNHFDALNRADKALYEAKNAGRNRVCSDGIVFHAFDL